jgi:RNA polymerase sigma-70 factor (ECF subfamily)
MSSTEIFHTYKRLLFSLAYNMLGSVEEAEDLVQDAFAAFFALPSGTVEHPQAYLCKIVVNKALTRKKQLQRQRYIGPWLPEPLVSFTPEPDEFDNRTALSIGILRLLERLTPAERAVYLLAETFAHTHKEIAALLDKTEAHSRKLLERAQAKLADGKQRFTATPERHEQLFQAFVMANLSGNFDMLREILVEDVASYADGGGKATAAMIPVFGREKNIRLLQNLASWSARKEPYTGRVCWVNGCLGVALFAADTHDVLTITTFAASPDGITELLTIRNPDKLKRVGSNLPWNETPRK